MWILTQLVYNEGIAVMQRVKVNDLQHLVVTLLSSYALPKPVVHPSPPKPKVLHIIRFRDDGECDARMLGKSKRSMP